MQKNVGNSGRPCHFPFFPLFFACVLVLSCLIFLMFVPMFSSDLM